VQVYEVLQYHKSPRYKDLLPVLGSQSMVMSEGHTWKAQRDAFNPGFSSSFLKTALPGFISCTEHLVQRLDAAAEQKEVVQLHHLTVLTTLEVICKVEDTPADAGIVMLLSCIAAVARSMGLHINAAREGATCDRMLLHVGHAVVLSTLQVSLQPAIVSAAVIKVNACIVCAGWLW
jgi:hypothetical protein